MNLHVYIGFPVVTCIQCTLIEKIIIMMYPSASVVHVPEVKLKQNFSSLFIHVHVVLVQPNYMYMYEE